MLDAVAVDITISITVIYFSQGQQGAGLKTTGLGIIISTLAYPFYGQFAF